MMSYPRLPQLTVSVFAFSFSLLFASCRAPRPPVLTTRTSTVPQMTAWVVLADSSAKPEVVSAREDVSRRDRGWWRAGDGSLAVRIRTDRGSSLKSHECGGVLVVETRDKQEGITIQIKNLRNRLLDVVVDAQGSDIFGQDGQLIERRGVLLDPNQVVKLRSQTAADGTSNKLPADTVTDVLALARHQPERMAGVIRLTVFYGAPDESKRQIMLRENEPRRSYEYR